MHKQILILILALGSVWASAQTLPGHWTSAKVCESCIPRGFAFCDSLHGMVVAHFGPEYFTYLTTDGGMNWRLMSVTTDFIIFRQFPPGFQPALTLITPSMAIWRVNNNLLITRDSGKSWQQTDAAVFPGGFICHVLIQDSARSLCFLTQVKQNIPTGQQYIKPSKDAFHTFEDIYGDTTFKDLMMQDALLVDSSNGWVEHVQKDGIYRYYRSSEGGVSWQEVRPFDGLSYNPYRRQRIQSNKAGNIICLVPDMLLSFDGGTTWKIDSTFGLRVSRLTITPDSKWWALVGQRIQNEYNYDPQFGIDTRNITVDSLAYSSDMGATWQIQEMKAGEVMHDVIFPDSLHGFIMSYSDSTTSVYRWAKADDLQVDPKPLLLDKIALAQNCLTLDLSESRYWTIAVFDITGREVYSIQFQGSSTKINLQSFSPGLYFLRAESGEITILKRFIKE